MKRLFLYGAAERYENYIAAFASVDAQIVASTELAAMKDCDALLLPGGADIAPERYHQENTASVGIDAARDAAEWACIEAFLAAKRPIFGICRGLQLLNVYFGGTLRQDVPNHTKLDAAHDRTHAVRAEGVLRTLYGERFTVNSAHHQVIDRLGGGLRALAWSEEGYAEAIRHETQNIFAVQWHPERTVLSFARPDVSDGAKLLKAFLETF